MTTLPQPHVLLIALDSVGIDPLGHDRPDSVYAQSTFLFPRDQAGTPLPLPDAPVEGLLVETDVTGGRQHGAIECALTYTSIFSGVDALAEHGLMQGLGLRERELERLIDEANLFEAFDRPCLANALFPAHLPVLGSSYVADRLPHVPRAHLTERLTYLGEPVQLRGPDKRGFAELFTMAEINGNVFVHAARQANVPLRTWDDVRQDRALTGSLTHILENGFDLACFDQAPLPKRTPPGAAAILAQLTEAHDFTFYKYQLADLVSHTGRVDLARDTFAVIETFLLSLLQRLDPARHAVIVTSDHGHLEQVGFTQGHPKSHVPTWCFGHGAHDWGRALTTPAAIHTLLTRRDPLARPRSS